MSLKVPYAAASAERGSALQMDKLGGAGRERVPVPVCLQSTCPWSTWKQKLSVALATQIAIGAQCRAPLLTRQRAMGEGGDVEGDEVQGRVYEGVAEGRAPSGMSV